MLSNKLLETRQQLSNLITYMDGKSGAEELVSKLLQDPALLQTLADARRSPGRTVVVNAESPSGEQSWLTQNPAGRTVDGRDARSQ